MRGNRKLACGALALDLCCGIVGFIYLITMGVKESGITSETAAAAPFPASLPLIALLAAVMVLSTLVMILALPKKK